MAQGKKGTDLTAISSLDPDTLVIVADKVTGKYCRTTVQELLAFIDLTGIESAITTLGNALAEEAIDREQADTDLNDKIAIEAEARQTAINDHASNTNNPHEVSLEQARSKSNVIEGNVNAAGNQIDNLANATENQQAATLNQLNAALQSAKDYADTVATDVLRWAGTWDASLGTFPTAGTGVSGTVRRGDTYEISVPGTIAGNDYEAGDTIRAKVNSPGQTEANWGSGQVNTQQATETKLGIAKVVNTATITDKDSVEDKDFVTAKKFWLGIGKMLAVAWNWTAKQTFGGGIKLTGVSTKFLKTDANGDVVGADKVQPLEVSTDSNNRFVTDAEKTSWNNKLTGEKATDAELQVTTAPADDNKYPNRLGLFNWWAWVRGAAGRFKLSFLTGTAERAVTVKTDGELSTLELVDITAMPISEQNKLLDSSNWVGKGYIGAPLTGCKTGMFIYDSNYFIYMVSDIYPIRLNRA